MAVIDRLTVGIEAETGGFERDMRRTAKVVDESKHHMAGLGGELHRLQASFGKGSASGHFLHALELRGPLAAIGIADHLIKEFAEHVKHTAEQVHEGTMTMGDGFVDMAKKIPLIGTGLSVVAAGMAVFGITEASEVRKQAAEFNKGFVEIQKHRRAMLDQREMGETMGPAKEDLKIQQEYAKSLEDINEHFAPLFEKLPERGGLFDTQHIEALHRLTAEQQAQRDLAGEIANQKQTELELTRQLEVDTSALKKMEDDRRENLAEIYDLKERELKAAEDTAEVSRRDANEADEAARDFQKEQEAHRQGVISRAMSIAQDLANADRHPLLPAALQAGSVGAVSAANRFSASTFRDPAVYAKQAVDIAQKQLNQLDELNNAIAVLVADDGTLIGGGY